MGEVELEGWEWLVDWAPFRKLDSTRVSRPHPCSVPVLAHHLQ